MSLEAGCAAQVAGVFEQLRAGYIALLVLNSVAAVNFNWLAILPTKAASWRFKGASLFCADHSNSIELADLELGG